MTITNVKNIQQLLFLALLITLISFFSVIALNVDNIVLLFNGFDWRFYFIHHQRIWKLSLLRDMKGVLIIALLFFRMHLIFEYSKICITEYKFVLYIHVCMCTHTHTCIDIYSPDKNSIVLRLESSQEISLNRNEKVMKIKMKINQLSTIRLMINLEMGFFHPDASLF